jgi:hypothetical protein
MRSRERGTVLAVAASGLVFGSSPAFADHAAVRRCIDAAERAQLLRNDEKLRDAHEALIACTDPACPDELRADCARFAAEVDAAMPAIVPRVVDARRLDVVGVRVWVDGQPLAERIDGRKLYADPGVHRFRWAARSGVATEETLTLRSGEMLQHTVILDERLRPDGTLEPPPRTLGYAALGGGILAAASFAVFEVLAQTGYASLKAGCGRTRACGFSDTDPIARELVIADASLGVLAIAAGISAWQFLSHARP